MQSVKEIRFFDFLWQNTYLLNDFDYKDSLQTLCSSHGCSISKLRTPNNQIGIIYFKQIRPWSNRLTVTILSRHTLFAKTRFVFVLGKVVAKCSTIVLQKAPKNTAVTCKYKYMLSIYFKPNLKHALSIWALLIRICPSSRDLAPVCPFSATTSNSMWIVWSLNSHHLKKVNLYFIFYILYVETNYEFN